MGGSRQSPAPSEGEQDARGGDEDARASLAVCWVQRRLRGAGQTEADTLGLCSRPSCSGTGWVWAVLQREVSGWDGASIESREGP